MPPLSRLHTTEYLPLILLLHILFLPLFARFQAASGALPSLHLLPRLLPHYQSLPCLHAYQHASEQMLHYASPSVGFLCFMPSELFSAYHMPHCPTIRLFIFSQVIPIIACHRWFTMLSGWLPPATPPLIILHACPPPALQLFALYAALLPLPPSLFPLSLSESAQTLESAHTPPKL